ncbi:MAG: hypothetical protein WA943_09465 [Parvibaculum sp.]|uniref:EF-hand domain-containing protein n=1 Tax=Parvibaculum sp. TaxID=2024848 RepID=UPI003C7750B9
MKNSTFATALPILTSIFFMSPTFANEKEPAYPPALISSLQAGNELNDFLGRADELLKRADPDGDGLDQADIDAEKARTRAQMRASVMAQWIIKDLNADDKVTVEEIIQSTRAGRMPQQAFVDRQVAEGMRMDTNGDGAIDIPEMLASVTVRYCGAQGVNPSEKLLALDPNKDGRLTSEELRAVATKLFRSLDTNGDGVISTTESQAGKTLIRTANSQRSGTRCPSLE